MKNTFLSIIAVFFIALPASARTITLVADEWPPFNIVPGGDREGYIVDIAKKVFEAEGYDVVYEILPWKRAVEMTREGKYEGVIGASKTDAESFVFPTEELAQNRLSFYVRKGSGWRFESKSAVNDVTLGSIAGYDYRAWLNEYIDRHKDDHTKIQIMTGEEPLKRNLLKLMSGRIGAVVDTEAAIRYVAGKMEILDEIECAGHGQEIAYIYIAFSPSNPDSAMYVNMLSDGIKRMRQNGTLQNILEKYDLADWK